MNMTRLLLAGLAIVVVTACDSGGVDLNVATTDNSVDNSTSNSGGGSTNPCASYTVGGATEVRQGTFDGRNCVYNSAFVGKSNPLTTDLTIPFISGVHIFQDSLFVGRDVSSGAAPASASDSAAASWVSTFFMNVSCGRNPGGVRCVWAEVPERKTDFKEALLRPELADQRIELLHLGGLEIGQRRTHWPGAGSCRTFADTRSTVITPDPIRHVGSSTQSRTARWT